MPLLTLSTDIGQTDYLTGAIKGQLVSAIPAVNIVDITHHLSPQNYLQAAYICNSAFRYFPQETFHIILINLFETSPEYLLLAEHNHQYIACPDNGILTMIAAAKPSNVIAVEVNRSNGLGVLQCTAALTDAFKKISNGKSLSSIGNTIVNIREKYPLRSSISTNWIDSQIIFIDNFENVVVNITRDEFEEYSRGRKFKIIFLRDEIIEELSENYASVNASEKLAWFNSAGYLEIAINKGNMAGLFGLQGYSENIAENAAMQNKLVYQTVRIFFEGE